MQEKMPLNEEEENMLYNIAWLRKYHRISKKRMAKMLLIGAASLNRIEKGEMPPRLGAGVLMRVYLKFGIRPAELVARRLDL